METAEVLMVDATYVKAHRTAPSFNKGACTSIDWLYQGGLTGKRPVVRDGKGRPVRFHSAKGKAGTAPALMCS